MNSPANLAADFESGTLNLEAFGHPEHVQAVWELIHFYGTLEAVGRFEAGLKRITAAVGHPEKYHATITHAFGFLVGQRVAEQGEASWEDFEAANPDLFEWPNAALARMYPDGVLDTDAARQTFVMPYSGRQQPDS